MGSRQWLFTRSTGKPLGDRETKTREDGELATSHTDLRELRCIGPRREPPRHGETKSMRKSGTLRTCCLSLKGISFGFPTCTSCHWPASTLENPFSSPKVRFKKELSYGWGMDCVWGKGRGKQSSTLAKIGTWTYGLT